MNPEKVLSYLVKGILYVALVLFLIPLLIILVILFLLPKEPPYKSLSNKPMIPFSDTLAGHHIELPFRGYQMDSIKFYHGPGSGIGYINANDSVALELVFEPYDEVTYRRGMPDQRLVKGINIYLKYKNNRIDSIRTALEKQFGKPFKPMVFSANEADPYWNMKDGFPFGNIVYSCEVNASTTIFLRAGSWNQGDVWHQFSPARIAIGYNLDKSEKAYFAATAHQFEVRKNGFMN